jgi:hypothetical protein
MTQSFKLAALAGVLAAALAAPAWSQPATTRGDPYDSSNTHLRSQCQDPATGKWKTTAQCQVFTRDGIPPGVVEGGAPANTAGASTSSSLNAGTTGSTSSLNSSSAMGGSTTRSSSGTSGATSGATSGPTSGATGGTSGGPGH